MVKLKIVQVDYKYCNYLRKYDSKVPYNYGKKILRPFVGILFKIGDCEYFAPLSSPKEKHLSMKNSLDFLKLKRGKLGALNFNNMIPVLKSNYKEIDLNAYPKTENEANYLSLLREQYFWLSKHYGTINNKAINLYNKYKNNTLSANIMKRCCNFILLEQICKEYNSRN